MHRTTCILHIPDTSLYVCKSCTSPSSSSSFRSSFKPPPLFSPFHPLSPPLHHVSSRSWPTSSHLVPSSFVSLHGSLLLPIIHSPAIVADHLCSASLCMPISLHSWASRTISYACQLYVKQSRWCFPTIPLDRNHCPCHHACISLSISISFHLHLAPSLPCHRAMVMFTWVGCVLQHLGPARPMRGTPACDSNRPSLSHRTRTPAPCVAEETCPAPRSTPKEGREFFLQLLRGVGK